MPKGLRFQGFGDRIRYRMEVTGIRSQADLANRLGEGAANVSRWITDNALPASMQKLEQLALILDVSVCWLLLGERGIENVREHGEWARAPAGPPEPETETTNAQPNEVEDVPKKVRTRRSRHSRR
jgi:transcriptional regulator with XRE-family HTH domain